MQELHILILQLMPKCKQWYFDGKNEEGKQVVIGKAKLGNYGITFKSIKDINLVILKEAMQSRAEAKN